LFCLGTRGDGEILAEETVGDGHNIVRKKKKKNKRGIDDGEKVHKAKSLTT
jgi:hypothetical protein